MLAAKDREQVMKWSDRQLGSQCGLVSISERGLMDMDESVEKDGTGIWTAHSEGCQPVMSIMANLINFLSDEQASFTENDSHLVGRCQEGLRATLH